MKFTEQQRQKISETMSRILTELWHRKWQDKVSFITQGYAQEKADQIIRTVEEFEPFSDVVEGPVFTHAVTDMQQSIERGHKNADEKWKNTFTAAIHTMAKKKQTFTSDDLVAYMRLYHPEIKTHDNRAAGALMIKAKGEGWCEPTEEKILSVRKELHYPANRITVWKSLIYQP